jgi:ankyrin repeat protein
MGADVTAVNNMGAEAIYYTDRILGPKKRKKIIDLFLKNGATINNSDKEGNTLLHRVVMLAMHDVAKELVKDFKKLINFRAKNKKGETAYAIAEKRRDTVLINLLRPFSQPTPLGDINFKDVQGDRPVMIAAMRGDLEEGKNLLRSGVKVNLQNKNGDTALHLAIKNQNIKFAQLLLKDPKTNINIKNKKGDTPLHEVINVVKPEDRDLITQELIKKGANINAKNNDGNTVFHLAVERNIPDLIKLLRAKIGSLVKNKKGKTALDLAVDLKRSDIAKTLEKR